MEKGKEYNKVISYDLNSVPESWNFDKVAYIAEKHGYLFYDSHSGGNAPTMVNPLDEPTKIFIDVSTEEGKELLKRLDEKNSTP